MRRQLIVFFLVWISVVTTGLLGSRTAAATTYLLTGTPSTVSLGGVGIGGSTWQVATLTNKGTGTVTISKITIAGNYFSFSGVTLPTTIARGKSLVVRITFAPKAHGTYAGTLSVTSNGSASPIAITLTGLCVDAQISLIPSSISFGRVPVGVTNTQTVTIRNPSATHLIVSQASVSGTGFSESGIALPLIIGPSGSSTFTIKYSPTSAIATTGTLTLASDAAATPTLKVALSGTGVGQTRLLSANPNSVGFGTVTVKSTANHTIVLTNNGNASLSISKVAVSGAGFSESGLGVPLSLAAGQSTSFATYFDPATAGALSGTVSITSNATNSPTTIALAGSGTTAVTHSVMLSWTHSTTTVAGYNVYVASQSAGPFTRVNSALIASTAYTDTSVVSGRTYYFVTTAVDSSGMESTYSNQVSAVIP